jgi:hypothetical protein
MRKSNIILSPYLDQDMVNRIHKNVNQPVPRDGGGGGGNNRGGNRGGGGGGGGGKRRDEPEPDDDDDIGEEIE